VQRLADGGTAVAVPGVAGAAAVATTVLADPRTNSLVVRAGNPARMASREGAGRRLDRPAAGGGVPGAPGMWVVHLKNADAAKLATVLRAAFAATGGSAAAAVRVPARRGRCRRCRPRTQLNPGSSSGTQHRQPQATAPVAASAQPQTGGYIQADPSTNSLIITAPEPLYRQLRAMIDQLDQRRAQVYIESMIVEVAGGDAADFGFEWLGALGNVRSACRRMSTTSAPNIVSINTEPGQGHAGAGRRDEHRPPARPSTASPRSPPSCACCRAARRPTSSARPT
jgi:general secretion pathway protein D